MPTQEIFDKSEKLFKGYQVLREIHEVDLATADKEVIWQEDKVTLYRYKSEKRSVKTPLLMVYALVNRHDMLDLQPDRSLVRKLLNEGIDVYIIDWGYPHAQSVTSLLMTTSTATLIAA